jgi:LysM repeat protein
VLLRALVLIGLICSIDVPAARTPQSASPHAQIITVRTGDTLWAIASAVTPEGADVRTTVDQIIDDNHLTSPTIVPGQHLVVSP